ALTLSLLGILGIDTASGDTSGTSGVALSFLAWKQVVFLIVGMLAAVVIALPHARLVHPYIAPAYTVVVLLLCFLLIAPDSIVPRINGTKGWIPFPGFNVQPAELAKIAVTLGVAANLTRRRGPPRVLVACVLVAIPIGLIALQPDLGTAALFVPALIAMLIAVSVDLRKLSLLLLAAVLIAPAGWPVLRAHQQERIIALWDQIQGDRSGEQDINFQSFTAQRLIGAGGIDGLGAGPARALVRYNQLPEAHNDMVFAVITARFGLLGALGLLAVYGLWLLGVALTAMTCTDRFARVVCIGLAAFIAGQAVINIGMNVGLLPIIGVTLPFVSYGGSSLITCWLMTGIIFNVAMRRPMKQFSPRADYPERSDRINAHAALASS
ncbi:MAG: FtsW/RodA/SpoVE family cell cycle protein, partial [Planctomycetota bacterium]